MKVIQKPRSVLARREASMKTAANNQRPETGAGRLQTGPTALLATLICLLALDIRQQVAGLHPQGHFRPVGPVRWPAASHQMGQVALLQHQQILAQLARNQHHRGQRQFRPNAGTNGPAADRRAAGGPRASPTEQQQAQQRSETGKLLVCYYTTRQSAPFRPEGAQEFVVPADKLPAAQFFGLNEVVDNRADSSGPPTSFSPMIPYEPFAGQQQEIVKPNRQATVELEFGSSNPAAATTGKNPQQQLLIKNNQLAGGQKPQTISASKPEGLLGAASQQVPVNNGATANKLQAGSVPLAGHLARPLLEPPLRQPVPSHDRDPSAAGAVDNSVDQFGHERNKQAIYSFVNELADNSLIVSAAGLNSAVLASSGQPLLGGGNNGHLANGYMKDNLKANNNGADGKQAAKQQTQQLVFSPPVNQLFIVGSSGAGGGTAPANLKQPTGGNNELLDTKSHLFIPSTYPTSSTISTIMAADYHQQQRNRQTSPPAGRQTSDSGPSLQRAKSLQVTEGELTPALPFNAGTTLSTTSSAAGPLPSAGSLEPVQTSYSYHNPQQASSAPPLLQHHFSQPASSGLEQLIVSNGQATASNNIALVGGEQRRATATMTTSGSFAPSNLLKIPITSASSNEVSIISADKMLITSSPPPPQPPASSVTAGPSSSTVGTVQQQQSVADATGGRHNQQQQQQQPMTTSSGTILSSALVSSPLSTMFDVFGAASQYLMRFKSSSLISPSSFAFNNIAGADHHGHHHAHGSTKSNGSSLRAAISPSSAASLISLPFSAASILSGVQKPMSIPSSDRSSVSSTNSPGVSSTSEAGGFLSRLTLQNNQRREDICGRTIQTPERRIIGGEGAKYGEFPYQVHIKIAKHQCGGALVDRQSIVTAAHCVYHFITRAPVNKLQIVIGAYDIEDEQYQELPPQYFKVNKVKLHPNFRFSASHPDRYDIAILKLDKPVKYTDNVLPVCLPGKDFKFESMVGTVTGFGKTDPSLSNRYGTRLLQKVDVPIIENNECERWHRTRGIDLKIFPEMMCAGYEDGLKDACVGDSGGPLVVKTGGGPNGSFRWTLAGITSAGFGCAQSRQPGIYHRVSHTVDWILENLD